QPARTTASHRDGVEGKGIERIVLELRGAEDADLARAEGGDVERGTIAAHGHTDRCGKALVPHGRRRARIAVVDVLVHVPPRVDTPLQDRDPPLAHLPPPPPA